MFTNLREAKAYVRARHRIYAFAQGDPDTFVAVEMEHNGRVYDAIGLAKCGKRDTFDAAQGTKIALGRAVAKIARKLYEDTKDRDLMGQLGAAAIALGLLPSSLVIGGRRHNHEMRIPVKFVRKG